MNWTTNPFWQQRITDTFQNALNTYSRVFMLRVDLRLPDISASTDAAAISRFTDALKEKINAYIQRKKREGKRVHPTTLRFIWVREYGVVNGKKHYHLVLLLNRDTWCNAGDYRAPGSLAGLIQQAWCSALRVDTNLYATLVNFPDNPALWIDRGNNEQLQEGLKRAAYLAKNHTKLLGDGERNFGCSRG